MKSNKDKKYWTAVKKWKLEKGWEKEIAAFQKQSLTYMI